LFASTLHRIFCSVMAWDAFTLTPATLLPTGLSSVGRSLLLLDVLDAKLVGPPCLTMSAFGFASPFLPAFLAGRGLGPEELGFVLSAATALRLVCGPIGGRLADRLHAFRAELAVCAILAASAALLYLAAHGFWTVMAISLLQAAALAPLVPLADALSLAHARPQKSAAGFEYGWVRGAGSAAFIAGTLLAGHAVSLPAYEHEV
jgi:MFS family permease